MSTFVLVHGGFSGGWCYGRVARQLREGGHQVFTPTMTGLGERSHLLSANVGLQTHIQDIINVILWEDLDDIILAGHSYGGSIITAVTERLPDRVAALVYIDAVVPVDGVPIVDQIGPVLEHYVENVPLVCDGLAVPLPVLPPGHMNNSEAEAWTQAKATPHPVRTLRESLHITGSYRDTPQRLAFIYASAKGRSANWGYERYRGEPKCAVYPLDNTGHNIMVDQPDELVSILVETAQEVDMSAA